MTGGDRSRAGCTIRASRRHGRGRGRNAAQADPPSGFPVAEDRVFSMDEIDRRILDLLQRDTTLSIAKVGERVGLSQTPC
jgi:hypothetical protein